jgi:hypothetical protein
MIGFISFRRYNSINRKLFMTLSLHRTIIKYAHQELYVDERQRKCSTGMGTPVSKCRAPLVLSKQYQLPLLTFILTLGIQVFDSIGYSRANAQWISQSNVAIFSSGRTDSSSGIEQRCKYFFYEGGEFKQACTSLIDSGYTTPRTRTSNASGFWDSDGSSVRVRIVSPPSYAGMIMYQKRRGGELVSPSGTRLQPD